MCLGLRPIHYVLRSKVAGEGQGAVRRIGNLIIERVDSGDEPLNGGRTAVTEFLSGIDEHGR